MLYLAQKRIDAEETQEKPTILTKFMAAILARNE
jgi:hypothetical protein